MKKIQTFIYILLMGVCFAACQEDDFGGSAQGGIRIALADGTAGVDVTTRSTPSELFDGFKEKFKFQIKGDNYDQTHNWTDDVISLAAGVYDITSTCGTEQADGVVEFDKPCYTGTKERQKVNAGETATTVEIPCEVTNALVSVQFGEEYKEFAEKAYAQISVRQGDSDGQRWDPLTTSAYFKAGSSLTKLKIYKDDDDSLGADILDDVKSDSNFPETFKAGDHLIITLSVAKKDGNIAFKVSKVELKEVTIKETIPMEWLPAPKIAGFNSGGTVSVEQVETADAVPAVLNFSGAMAIQDVELTLDLKDQDFSSLNKTYMLASLSEDDKATLTNAGITLPALGENASSIDFTTLAGKLKVASGSETSHDIKLRVKANDRWSSEEGEPSVYTIKTVAPKITVTANEGDIWSKSVTISGITVEAGNESTIKENLKYQFYENGTWKDCEGMVAAMENHPSDGKMQVRAVYRDVIECEPTTFDLETPAQLPNSGFEDWYEEDQSDHKNLWFPYAHEASGPQWTTNNLETTHSSSDAWDSPSAVKRTTVKNSGNYAVWIRTVGHGNTNTNAGVTPGVEWAITGTHTKGVLSYSNVFTSRPTQVSFYYRYIQKGDDAGVVELKIENQEQNIVLFETSFTVTNTNYIKRDIPITYSVDNVCATHMTLTFISGSKHEEVVSAKARKNNVDGTEANEHYGSEFYVDDISLVYDK